MDILTIGDSHAVAGWLAIRIPNVGIYPMHLGEKLMYSFDKSMINLEKILFDSNDCIVFCFGEIDVRCHVYKHARKKGYRSVIADLVKKYLDTITMCIDCIKDKSIKICVYFVPPAPREAIAIKNTSFPFKGTDKERKQYTLFMNSLLRIGCKKNGLIFIDLYEDYCDLDGFLNPKMGDGCVHIQDTSPLVSFIKRELI